MRRVSARVSFIELRPADCAELGAQTRQEVWNSVWLIFCEGFARLKGIRRAKGNIAFINFCDSHENCDELND